MEGKIKTYLELRQSLYESILDEVVFISRSTEGAVTPDWILSQPIFIRKKYLKELEKELKERENKLNKSMK